MMMHRILIALLLVLALPFSSLAQSTEDDRGYLQAFLEDNLSDTGREIKIIGFQGALSSQATVDEITIADRDGIWLSMKGLTLGWTRSALLTGNVKIDVLEADQITLFRRPIPEPGLPAPEAGGFSLPELPVSLNIGSIRATRVILGDDILGTAAEISLQGSASLESGSAVADVDITRLDGPAGTLSLAGSYQNTTRMLDLALNLNEDANGLAANLLNIPDHPALSLSINGSGPLSDFQAQVAMATAGQDRLTGSITLSETPAAPPAQTDTATADRQIALDLSGDISPLLHPDFQGFFGEAVTLTARASQPSDGTTRVDALSIKSASLDLTGDLLLAPDGWPKRVALHGKIAAPDGQPVRLPVSGAPMRVTSADIAIAYDNSEGDGWNADINLDALVQDDLRIDTVRLHGSGTARAGTDTSDPVLNGALRFDAQGVHPDSPELAEAIGSDLTGTLQFDLQTDALAITALDLSGADYGLTGALTLSDLSDGAILRSNGLRLTAADLSQFAGLAGTPLSGRVTLDATGEANIMGGAFDLSVTGQGADLRVGQKQLDAVIGGTSTLALHTLRDTDGTRIETFKIETKQAQLALSADVKTDGTTAQLNLTVPNTSAIDPQLNGSAQMTASLTQTGSDWEVDADITGPGGASLTSAAQIEFQNTELTQITGTLSAKIAQLAPYSGLARRPLSGGLTFAANGQMQPGTDAFSVTLDGTAQSLGTGMSQLDAILRGETKLALAARKTSDAPILLERLSLRNTALMVTAKGQTSDTSTNVSFQTRLSDLGLLAEGISGPMDAQGNAKLVGENWQLALDATGPAGVNARVNGTIRTDGGSADLAMSGTAPLALANSAIRPRLATGTASYDLTLRGPLALSALTGTIATQGARVALPRLKQSVDIDRGQVTLAAGVATLDVQSSIPAGGRVTTSGSIALTPPLQTDLSILVDQLRLTDGAMFETTVDGTAGMRGPLQGGATLRAVLTLGRTELRIPETTAGTLPVLEGLKHVGEPASVRQTRQFAGLIVAPAPATAGRPYPLDITLNAPGKIFVRGRGLDAELGGALRVTGTSAEVIPQGEFDLIRGRLDILGKRLTLTEGEVNLQGDFNAYLRFLAEAQAEDTTIQIGLTGPASSPEVSFSSSPQLPEDEVLARLLFGKDITQISAIQALRLAAAVRTLAGKGGEGILGKLRGNFALDDLDVTTDETGAASVKAGKYISENVYTDVTVGADGKAEINLNLNISPSLTARGTLGSDGDTGVGIYFEKDY